MHCFKALQVLKQGKKQNISQEQMLEAAKKVNEFHNRIRLRRIMAMGYSKEEAERILYATP
jgi:hypothetical protein